MCGNFGLILVQPNEKKKAATSEENISSVHDYQNVSQDSDDWSYNSIENCKTAALLSPLDILQFQTGQVRQYIATMYKLHKNI